MAASKKKTVESVVITAPRFEVLEIPIIGKAPFVSNKFSEEAKIIMLDNMMKTKAEKSKKVQPPKNLQAEYEGSLHRCVDEKGETLWYGIPAIAVKAAVIRACKLVGLVMTDSKMVVFTEGDGYSECGDELFRITKGEPVRLDSYVRNANGSPDIRGRGMFSAGWEATLRLRYDADFIKKDYVINLVQRAGLQVGIGAGRPSSTASVGMGWGTFDIKGAEVQQQIVAA